MRGDEVMDFGDQNANPIRLARYHWCGIMCRVPATDAAGSTLYVLPSRRFGVIAFVAGMPPPVGLGGGDGLLQ